VKHPDIYALVLVAGQLTGNPTYNHLDGWTTDPALYFRNIEKAEALIGNGLFPPALRPSAAQGAMRSPLPAGALPGRLLECTTSIRMNGLTSS